MSASEQVNCVRAKSSSSSTSSAWSLFSVCLECKHRIVAFIARQTVYGAQQVPLLSFGYIIFTNFDPSGCSRGSLCNSSLHLDEDAQPLFQFYGT